MYILGLQMGHNATVALLKDGKIISAVSQERFDRVKNSRAFPTDAIKWTFDNQGITSDDLDAVAVCGVVFPVLEVGVTSGISSPSLVSKIWGRVEYKHPKTRKVLSGSYIKFLKSNGKKNQKKARQVLSERLNINPEKIHFVEHHVAHAYTAYFGMREPDFNDDALVITLDGAGDFYCGSVNVVKDNKIKRIASIPLQHSLGYIYSQTTAFLGMKPLEHEYKVMGLAPYAKDYYLKTYEDLFKPMLWIDKKNPLQFKSKFSTNRTYNYLKDHAVGVRFDNIGAALQHLTEDLLETWIKNAVKKTGINNVFLGGGVFMNVKANLRLSALKEIKHFSVHPSCGDESNPFGACYYVYIDILGNEPSSTHRVKDIYLGPYYTNEDIKQYIEDNKLNQKYDVKYYEDVEKQIAKMISKGEIVARFAGREEWGARSLGNRAILGDPSTLETFYKVNDQIKMRDFWMPFAPTMLIERADEYVENPHKREAPYMILAFKSTDLGKEKFRAALHQGDHTLRPQLIEEDWNPGYYKIAKEFEKITGIGGILNTSFNLHGEPIVHSPADAVHTLKDSGLQHLALENYIISKKKK